MRDSELSSRVPESSACFQHLCSEMKALGSENKASIRMGYGMLEKWLLQC